MFFRIFWAPAKDQTLCSFALFLGTALSISALPVVARVLMDLGLLRTEMGTVIMSSAMCDDLVGWILFGLVLGMLNPHPEAAHGIRHTIILVLGFAVLMLTVGRWLIHKLLPFIQSHTTWPGGVLGFIFSRTLASAAFAEYAGIHAVFGGFITGAAVGESAHLRERTSEHIHQIVTNVFAPLFFASIGLHTNFVSNFHLGVTAAIQGDIILTTMHPRSAELKGIREIAGGSIAARISSGVLTACKYVLITSSCIRLDRPAPASP